MPATPDDTIEITELPEIQVDESGDGPRVPPTLPVLPIRDSVTFPGTIMPLGVGRPGSRRLLDESLPKSKLIALVTQLDPEEDEPPASRLHKVGTLVNVLKLIRQSDDTVSIIVHGMMRLHIQKMEKTQPYYIARVRRMREKKGPRSKVFKAAVAQLREQAKQLIELSPAAPEQAMNVLLNIDEPGNLADFLAANLNLEGDQQQDLLEEPDVAKRVRIVHQYVSSHLEIAKLQHKIQEDVQSSISESQRRLFLREQVKAIQRELGEEDGGIDQAVEELRKRLKEAAPPENVMKECERELERLTAIPPASPEYSMIVTYLELVADLPWSKSTQDHLDLERAQRILDRDHYGLNKVKRRIIEYLAVRKLNPQRRGPILCFVGPPGVGKTSLGQSIADALGRKFVRLSLGGIRDEAEIRGHRRTYIGAMPGRIIQELRRAGTNNPVMMLDEVDKLGADFRGDPSSALLEVLDPRQNDKFVDRYLDVAFDLSQVMFIATANYMGTVPPALRDRMEVISLPGYTDNDKLQIAKKYLVPRQLKENGLPKSHVRWRVGGLRKVINDYTREAGVRELERQIGSVCRGIAADVARRKRRNSKTWIVDEGKVREVLGAEKYFREVDTRTKTPGVVVGLAYTSVGGDILFIEAASYPGKGRVTLTGNIGDVMKESASAALSLFKARAKHFQYELSRLNERDVHIHVPAGAVPKDGPSAGVAMYTAIVSLLMDVPVKPRIAMTGEVTLRGLVLPIGGVKEKSLAGARAGIHTIILPDKNRRDLEEIDPQVKKKLRFEFAADVDELVDAAFDGRAMNAAIRANEKRRDEAKKNRAAKPAPAKEGVKPAQVNT